MKRRITGVLLLGVLLCTAYGCNMKIEPPSADSGTYSTQNRLSSLEYSIYMNKQIVVFVNQIATRLTMIQDGSNYENEILLAKTSADILDDAYEEVICTYPSEGSDGNRDATLTAMETAILHLDAYIGDMEENKDVSDYKDEFKNDFNALTGLATLYYQ